MKHEDALQCSPVIGSLSWKRLARFTSSNPISPSSILILSSHLHLVLPSGSFSWGIPTKTLYAFFIFSSKLPPCFDHYNFTKRGEEENCGGFKNRLKYNMSQKEMLMSLTRMSIDKIPYVLHAIKN